MTFFRRHKKWLLLSALGILAVTGGGASTLIVGCGPFTDVSGPQCPFILELYNLGIAAGTGPGTFNPTGNVTRGQVAVFMGAGINLLRRNSNPFRIATRTSANGIQFNYENYASANTGFPNGFCTDGGYNYVANQSNNKIDVYNNGYGNGLVFSYTTTTANNRLLCDGTYIYATSVNGNTVKRINTHTGTVQDPWVTMADSNAGDIANAGYAIAVATNTGITLIGHGGNQTPVPLGGPPRTRGVIFDSNGYFWADAGANLKKIDGGGNVVATVPLSGSVDYYLTYDGASIWAPIQNGGGIDIVSNGGVVIDHLNPAGGANTVRNEGGVFNGQYVVMAELGNYQSCSGNTQGLINLYDPGTHALVENIFTFCGDGSTFTTGFDGRFLHVLAYDGNHHYLF